MKRAVKLPADDIYICIMPPQEFPYKQSPVDAKPSPCCQDVDCCNLHFINWGGQFQVHSIGGFSWGLTMAYQIFHIPGQAEVNLCLEWMAAMAVDLSRASARWSLSLKAHQSIR